MAVPNQLEELDLGAELARAIEDYRVTWRTVDLELYELCRRRPSQRTFADVYAKVALIGRVYEAGIPRSVRTDGNREAAVARGLVKHAGLIEETLDALAGHKFGRATAAQCIELHARIARGILPYTGETWQQSFVSKYLHFHCDLVPIYDSRAQGAIHRFVKWPVVYSARSSMGRPPDWLTSYYNFATAFVVLYERVDAETSIQPSVKELDHLLWRTA